MEIKISIREIIISVLLCLFIAELVIFGSYFEVEKTASGEIVVANSGAGNVQKFKMSCESDSMGITLRCNDKLTGIRVKPTDKIQLGDIYTYSVEGKNDSIVHRAVLCEDENCSVIIFKGDNNLIAEKVDRTQIQYHIRQVNLR